MPAPALLEIQPQQSLQPQQLQALALEKRSPRLYGQQLLFLYQGHAQTRSVELAGELTGWHSLKLRFQEGPNKLFYLLADVPEDARMEYKLLVDGEWTEDPFNPNRVINGLGGTNSAFEMPAYRHDPYQLGPDTIPTGRVDEIVFEGQSITGKRRLQVYLPAGLNLQSRYPVIYFQDGSDYMSRARLPRLLERLITSRAIEPMIAVCIDPIHRFQEYSLNPDYARLLTEEILPLIDRRYPTQIHAQARTLSGSSMGGLISAYVAHQHPEHFGQVLGQSSSMPYQQERLRALFESTPKRDLKLYLSAGRLEGLLTANRRFEQSLSAKAYANLYREYNEGHNWTHWSNRLSEGLIYLFGKNRHD